jgi:hypothetical protein
MICDGQRGLSLGGKGDAANVEMKRDRRRIQGNVILK